MTINVEQGFVILEGASGAVEEWCNVLHIDQAFVASLVTQGVFQRSRTTDGQSRLRLNMVGLLATQQKAFFCLPKICVGHDIDIPANMQCALTAIQTYQRHIQRGPEASRSGEADIFLGGGSLLDHFLRLWEWTRDFGLHRNEEPVRDDGYRAINWRSTISSTLPVHQFGGVIYAEPIGEKFSSSLSDLGAIQAFALLSLRKLLGGIADIWSEKHDDIWSYCEETIDDSSLYLLDRFAIDSILDEYEVICTRDNDRELLELLKGFFNSSYRKSLSPIIYGVSSFHVVWEHMCVSLLNDFGISENHALIASQPSYNIRGNELNLEPQRPDILRSINQGIIIGDAKWYRIESEEVPKTPDAIKQFSYQSSILDKYSILGNFLFLPMMSSVSYVHIGSLEMKSGQKKDSRFSIVQLIGLGWGDIVNLYAKSGHFPPNFYDWLVEIGAGKAIAPGLVDAQP